LRISGSPLLPMMRFREREVGFVMGRDQFAGKQQAPGGGVNEQRRAAADVRLPVTVADFVADQRVAGGFIRNTQQRFRQTHQRHPSCEESENSCSRLCTIPARPVAVFWLRSFSAS
jgi:hypothetical protein